MIQVLKKLHARHPEVTFLVACYRVRIDGDAYSSYWSRLRRFRFSSSLEKLEIIEAADCALMVSGSVSLG